MLWKIVYKFITFYHSHPVIFESSRVTQQLPFRIQIYFETFYNWSMIRFIFFSIVFIVVIELQLASSQDGKSLQGQNVAGQCERNLTYWNEKYLYSINVIFLILPTVCEDISSKCTKLKKLCNKNPFVTKRCQKTCGICGE